MHACFSLWKVGSLFGQEIWKWGRGLRGRGGRSPRLALACPGVAPGGCSSGPRASAQLPRRVRPGFARLPRCGMPLRSATSPNINIWLCRYTNYTRFPRPKIDTQKSSGVPGIIKLHILMFHACPDVRFALSWLWSSLLSCTAPSLCVAGSCGSPTQALNRLPRILNVDTKSLKRLPKLEHTPSLHWLTPLVQQSHLVSEAFPGSLSVHSKAFVLPSTK